MGKIQPSPLVGSLSGRFGAYTIAQSGDGLIVRRYSQPIDIRTPATLEAQSTPGRILNGWRNLTDAQRTAWRTAGAATFRTDRFGVQRAYTGLQLYWLYVAILLNGNPTSGLTPPASIARISPQICNAYAFYGGAHAITLSGSPWPASTPTVIPYFARGLTPQQMTPYRRGRKLQSFTQAYTTSNLAALIAAKTSMPYGSERIALGARWHLAPGIPGQIVYAPCVVDATPITIDNFEVDSSGFWNATTGAFARSTTYAYSGTYSYRLTNTQPPSTTSIAYSTYGLPHYPTTDTIWSLRIRKDANLSAVRIRCHGLSTSNCYEIAFFQPSWNLVIYKITADAYTQLVSAASLTIPSDEWLHLRIARSSSNSIVTALYKANGTLISRITTSDATHNGPLVSVAANALDATTTYVYFDALQIEAAYSATP